MPKQMISPIEKGRIRLRLLERSDLPMTLRWRNQNHIRKWFVHPEVISPENHQQWFEQYWERDNDYVFIIEETRDFQKPVGQVSLYNIVIDQKRAEFGRLMIGETEALGLGLAKQATGTLLELGFKRFRLKEVYLEVFEDNSPAIEVYRQCGFQFVLAQDGLLTMRLLNRGPYERDNY